MMVKWWTNRKKAGLMAIVFVCSLSAVGWAQSMTQDEGGQLLQAALAYATIAWEQDGIGQLGVPYVWGGRISVERFAAAAATGDTTSVGVDASGLIMGALQAVRPGIAFRMQRGDEWTTVSNVTSDALYRWNVTPVAVADLRPGDLIFFAGTDGNVNGVAIYERMAGRNVRFVTASANSGRVVQTSANLDGEYWASRFAGAGRFVWSEAGE